MYAIHVKFREYGRWSNLYTYVSPREFVVGDFLLLPTGDFFGVGKVFGCDREIDPNKKYKAVLAKLNKPITDYKTYLESKNDK